MTLDELYRYFEQPELLNAETLPEMKKLVETYPYSAPLVFLYLYNLSRSKDLQYTSELKRLSPYLHDRRMLFQMVHGGFALKKSPAKEPKSNDAFSLIESFLGEQKASGTDLPNDLSYAVSSDRDDYFASALGQESLQEHSLLKKPEENAENPEKKVQPSAKGDKGTIATEDLEEELFTETLAKIYIKQGKYEKALRIIRSISLNYPKKNRYFANQIRFLEILVRNNKDNI